MKRLALLLLLVISGCAVQEKYVMADRLTYQAVSPEYMDYVEGDPTLTDEQRDRRRRTVYSWDARIKQAEGGQ